MYEERKHGARIPRRKQTLDWPTLVAGVELYRSIIEVALVPLRERLASDSFLLLNARTLFFPSTSR